MKSISKEPQYLCSVEPAAVPLPSDCYGPSRGGQPAIKKPLPFLHSIYVSPLVGRLTWSVLSSPHMMQLRARGYYLFGLSFRMAPNISWVGSLYAMTKWTGKHEHHDGRGSVPQMRGVWGRVP